MVDTGKREFYYSGNGGRDILEKYSIVGRVMQTM